jgi:hypothetical protein
MCSPFLALCRQILRCLDGDQMPNLRHLRIKAYDTSEPSADLEELGWLGDLTPHLETLILPRCVIKGCNRFTIDQETILIESLSKWSNITTLSLDHSDITNTLLKALPQTTPNVEDLSVAGCPRIGGAALVQFAKFRKNKKTNERGLRRLDISGSFKVRNDSF